MKKYVVALFFICTIFLFSCQKTKDIFLVLQQAESFMNVHPDSALLILDSIPTPEKLTEEEYATWCLLTTQAQDKMYIEHTSDSIINIAICYFDRQSDPNRQAQAYYCKGRILSDLLESDEALEAYLKAYDYIQQTSNYSLKARICNHLGTLYWKNRMNEKNLDWYRAAHSAYEECRDTAGIVNALRNVGRSLVEMKQSDSALFYLKEALDIAEKGNIKAQKSYIHAHIGSLLSENGLYKEALASNLKALYLTDKKEMLYPRYYAVASLYEKIDRLDSALYYAGKSLEGGSLDVECSANRLLSLIYSKDRQYEKALQCNERFILLRDSLEHIFQPVELTKVEALYNKARLENKQYKEIQAIEDKRKAWVITLLCVCLVALFAYFYLSRRIYEQKRSIDEYQRRLMENEQSLSVSREMIRSKEEVYNAIQFKLEASQKLLEDYTDQIQQLADDDLKTQEGHQYELTLIQNKINSLLEELERIYSEKMDLTSKHSVLLGQQNKLYAEVSHLSKVNKKIEEQIVDLKQKQALGEEEYEQLKREAEFLGQEKEQQLQQARKILDQYKYQNLQYEEWVKKNILRNPYLSKLIETKLFHTFEAKDWKIFEMNFDQIFPDFRKHLLEKFPTELNERDIRICCLVKLGIKTGKISEMLNLDPSTITKQKKEICTKCFLSSGRQSLEGILSFYF